MEPIYRQSQYTRPSSRPPGGPRHLPVSALKRLRRQRLITRLRRSPEGKAPILYYIFKQVIQ